MTTSIPMPVIPDPDTDEILFRMLKLILENPLYRKTKMTLLEITLKLNIGVEKEYNYLNSDIITEWEKTDRMFNKNTRDRYIEVPDGREGVNQVLNIIKHIKGIDRTNLPKLLRKGKLNKYILTLGVSWENFNDWIDIKATVNSNTRKLEIGYFPNSFDNDPRVLDKKGYLSHLSKPFIDLFHQFKSMFNREWPDKYIILPSISDRKERALILSELRKRPFKPSKYRKMDEYIR